jgi:hypothetical protein
MSAYLEGYGAGEERRARIIRSILISAVVLIVGGLGAYFGLRNFSKRQKLDSFIQHLQNKDYKAAHALWGCTDATPCRDYNFERFLRDWGPESPAANAASARLITRATCGGIFSVTGILRIYRFDPDYEVALWVDAKDGNVGFAPHIGRMQCTILP